jgi:Arc/MetJ family transcription regulator
MRTTIEIDDALMTEAQKASGQTKKQTVEQALRLLVRLRRQDDVGAAFGKYRWRGNLARSRKGRGTDSPKSAYSVSRSSRRTARPARRLARVDPMQNRGCRQLYVPKVKCTAKALDLLVNMTYIW